MIPMNKVRFLPGDVLSGYQGKLYIVKKVFRRDGLSGDWVSYELKPADGEKEDTIVETWSEMSRYTLIRHSREVLGYQWSIWCSDVCPMRKPGGPCKKCSCYPKEKIAPHFKQKEVFILTPGMCLTSIKSLSPPGPDRRVFKEISVPYHDYSISSEKDKHWSLEYSRGVVARDYCLDTVDVLEGIDGKEWIVTDSGCELKLSTPKDPICLFSEYCVYGGSSESCSKCKVQDLNVLAPRVHTKDLIGGTVHKYINLLPRWIRKW
jgi:hypothetical protein